ncbi:MAG: flavodoxin [Euryarchaeota archaeon RBG_19FT_COMBO_56_21]|nr:MAG: flavodoxin [Euryarchaeota archaeon RBG_19FT_COMBO_56_21]
MRVLIVYDSVYGNTEQIAKAIGGAIDGEVRVVRASEVDAARMEPVDIIIVGSPTLGGRPSQPIQEFLDKLPATSVKGIKVAAFDTRYSGKFVKIFGFAAEKIAASLEAKGGTPVPTQRAFIVTGKKGPLKEGELERAASWAKEIVK